MECDLAKLFGGIMRSPSIAMVALPELPMHLPDGRCQRKAKVQAPSTVYVAHSILQELLHSHQAGGIQ